ncbi:MAG: hypothetical protein P1U58_17740, partial [Verrucomicrobiales bacterium]|nr:hypothetical protein [Verrucomicrobiales bacterium]
MKKDWEWHSLIARYQAGQLSDEEFAELEEALRNSKEVRAIYHQASRFDSSLRRESEQVVNRDEERAVVPFRKTPLFGRLAAAAAVVILSALTITIAAQKRIVATLVSSENAAWESALPTVEGAKLSRGSLRLSTGIATIRFDSGVELTLEAPARLFIKGSKRASLVHGTAILKSSDSDEFMLETQLGQAVSRDSEYIVSAGKDPNEQRFEVLSGEAWVSHDRSREAVKVVDGEYALLTGDGLVSNEMIAEEPPIEQFEQGLRISSESRSATFIRNDNPYKWTRPEFLTLKKSNSGNLFDQYCVVGFDLGMVNPAQV